MTGHGIPSIRRIATMRTQRPGRTGPAPWVTRDRQKEAIEARDHERRRRALWADCERRPLEMDNDG